MKTTFLLIRHGQTDWNAQRRWQGHEDIPLNDNGQQQAQAIAQRLASWPLQAIYSSDLKRAAETAVAIAHPHQLQPIYQQNLRERKVGIARGLTTTELEAQHPDVWDQWQRGLIHYPPGGETPDELRQRIVAAFDIMQAKHAGQTVALVSHGGTLAALVAHVLQIPTSQRNHFSLRGNTGLSIIEISKRGPHLTLLNDISHLNGTNNSNV